MSFKPGILRKLGVYGYGHIEPVIVAALVTAKPLLLIGKAGTAKSLLLNSLSAAMSLVHRHYNASLIAFDDLVGFPYPEEGGKSIRYIETPATVWDAESVLIDEISRCKPEHQNRLFSLVHERRIQGMKIKSLKYCWAAMNPCSPDQGVDDYYDGSVPLDQALADRFAFVVEVPDWEDLSAADRKRVANPSGTDSTPGGLQELQDLVKESLSRLGKVRKLYGKQTINYAIAVADTLANDRVRLSPRRVSMLAENLMALTAVCGGTPESKVFRRGLGNSLPNPAWGAQVDESSVAAAHKLAWEHALMDNETEKWINGLLLDGKVERRVATIVAGAPDPDTASVGIKRLLAIMDPDEAAILALALYPAALEGHVELGTEGLAALSKVAQPILNVSGSAQWRGGKDITNPIYGHEGFSECSRALGKLRGARKERARQLFYHLIVAGHSVQDATRTEKKLNTCVSKVTSRLTRAA
jgi:MoxR-like ATPase